MGLQLLDQSKFRKQVNTYNGHRHEPVVTTAKETSPHYVSLPPAPKKEAFIALKEAAHKLASILEARGIDVDDIIQDFQRERRRKDCS